MERDLKTATQRSEKLIYDRTVDCVRANRETPNGMLNKLDRMASRLEGELREQMIEQAARVGEAATRAYIQKHPDPHSRQSCKPSRTCRRIVPTPAPQERSRRSSCRLSTISRQFPVLSRF